MTVNGQSPVTYTYDAASRLTQIVQGSQAVALEYDALDRRSKLALPNQVSTEYQYDAASRLTQLTYTGPAGPLGNVTYQYDASGNRVGVGGSFARTLLPDPVPGTTYDAANRQVAFGGEILTYDRNGNLTGDGANTYTWDSRNRLAAITGLTSAASFQYDPFGRRVRKTLDGITTEFLYDGDNPVQEISSTTGLTTSLPGLGLDEIFHRTDAAGPRMLLTDALGSTLALTDAAGTLQTTYTYAPFGATSVAGSASENSLQFTGREHEGTGLYYYRLRYYHPTRQRFLSEDPIGLAGGDVNLYAYVRNQPTLFVDPYGLWCPDCHYEQTRERAEACGLSPEEAGQAAQGNKDMDTRDIIEALKPRSPKHAMPGSPWRQYAAAQLQKAITLDRLDRGRNSPGAMQALGAGLHAIQDAWSHDLRTPPGTLTEHIPGERPGRETDWVNPDSPAQNPWEWDMARRATEEYIKDFMRGRGQKPTCD